MRDRKKAFSRSKALIYIILSYVISWSIWIGSYMLKLEGTSISLFLNIFVMWVPALSVWLTQKLTKGDKILSLSMRLKVRQNLRWYFIALIFPFIATIFGGLLYFAIFRGDFDISFSYMKELIDMSSGPELDVPLNVIVIAQIASALTYAPFINMLAALGEEIGWRGFLFPELAKRYSKAKAHIITGLIWGVWHTPINMMGHNYGLEYRGYPWLGIIAMCIFCFSAGVILSWLAEKSNTVWTAALGHGAINAAAGIPMLFMTAENIDRQIFGPALSGLLAGIPLFIFGVVVLLKETKYGVDLD